VRSGREHPAGGTVPAWALAGLRPAVSRGPKPVRGQTDIFDALDRLEPKLRADGQLEGQTDIFDVLAEPGGDDDRAA
jgi:hypothetical protein